MLQRISKEWDDVCVVAASGPSLTQEIADGLIGIPTVAVNDAYQLFPWADILYACDARWWDYHKGVRWFRGGRMSSHGRGNEKEECAAKYGLTLVAGKEGDGFSSCPKVIHYGGNSGFQAINVALHKIGFRGKIALVGFDMRVVGGKRHFFGDHPAPMKRSTDYSKWFGFFDRAAQLLPNTVEVVNCTPGSELPSFPKARIRDVVSTPLVDRPFLKRHIASICGPVLGQEALSGGLH